MEQINKVPGKSPDAIIADKVKLCKLLLRYVAQAIKYTNRALRCRFDVVQARKQSADTA
jgi:hypothetical protein